MKSTVSQASTTHSSMGRTQSKWLTSLTRQNYIYFSEKLQALDTKNRIKALKKMRMRMKTRYMMVYRLFRLKKYGESIGPVILQKRMQQSFLAPKN